MRTFGTEFKPELDPHTISTRLQLLPVGSTECTRTPESLGHDHMAHTIQVEANFMTIIQENADHMPNEFRNIGRKRVKNFLVLPSVLNWDHMRDISNSVLHSIQFLCFALLALISIY